MATVCAGAMALMDAGVPIKAPVAGIAMGLIKEGDRVAVLSDILGVEDHLGDMDFKVTGTREGVTAFQMDTKIGGISFDILSDALGRAREARMHILDIMARTLEQPRQEMSPFAPRIIILNIQPDKIREVIGPGGKIIKRITEETGTQIDIEDSGEVRNRGHQQRRRPACRGDDPQHHRGSGARPGVSGQGAQRRGFRRLRRDRPRTRRPAPHLGDRPPSGGAHRGRAQRRRPGDGPRSSAWIGNGKIKLSRKALLPEPEGGVPAGSYAGGGGGGRERDRDRDRDRDRGGRGRRR